MPITIAPASNEDVLPLRVRGRVEANGQIVHDSIHQRRAWTLSWLLQVNGLKVGFGSIAVNGPWKGKPTIFEFYVLPEWRGRAFELFEAFMLESRARFFEVQTNDALLTVMLHTYGCDLETEKIVFCDRVITAVPGKGAKLKRVTSEQASRRCFDARHGTSKWRLKLNEEVIGTGGLMFHYNYPFCDVYMEIAEAYRRCGFGAYLVQELKRIAYGMGGIPGARCDRANVASRKTLQKAGFIPCANIVLGKIASPSA